jgi:hypothetical protein
MRRPTPAQYLAHSSRPLGIFCRAFLQKRQDISAEPFFGSRVAHPRLKDVPGIRNGFRRLRVLYSRSGAREHFGTG